MVIAGLTGFGSMMRIASFFPHFTWISLKSSLIAWPGSQINSIWGIFIRGRKFQDNDGLDDGFLQHWGPENRGGRNRGPLYGRQVAGILVMDAPGPGLIVHAESVLPGA
jgi:hypothetical protein